MSTEKAGAAKKEEKKEHWKALLTLHNKVFPNSSTPTA